MLLLLFWGTKLLLSDYFSKYVVRNLFGLLQENVYFCSMKRIVLLFFAAIMPAIAAMAQPYRFSARLSTYNIRHGEGLDGRIDHERIGRILRKAHAEVAAIQEVDSMTRRNGGVYDLAEIGRAAGMHATFAAAIDFQGGKYGVGILSREVPLSVRRIALPGREEPRMLLVAEFKDYVVACTHLSLHEEDRLSSIGILVAEACRWHKPFFVMGDMNDEPGSAFYARMAEHFLFVNDTTEMTFPAGGPTVCIDHIALFRAPGVALSRYRTWVGDDEASDHCPLHGRVKVVVGNGRFF